MSEKSSKTETIEVKPRGGKVPSRKELYSFASLYSKEAIEELVKIMRSGKQESVRMAASKSLLDKALPDLKAMEVSGNEGKDLKLIVKIIDEKHDSESADS